MLKEQLLPFELLVNERYNEVLRHLIDEASERVLILSYLASTSKFMEPVFRALAFAVERGVLVAVALNGARGKAKSYNTVAKRKLNSLGVSSVKLTGKFNHAKLAVIDDIVIIGSHNLSGSSYGGRMEVSLLVKSKRLSDWLTNVFWEVYTNDEMPPKTYRDVDNGAYFEVFTGTRIIEDLKEKTELAEERVKILMYVASISRSTKRYYSLLRDKQEEGLDTYIVLNGKQKLALSYNKRVYEYLKSIGYKRVVLSKRFIHAKLFLVDNTVITGSHNLTASSSAGRLELSIAVTQDRLARGVEILMDRTYRVERKRGRGNAGG